MKRVVMSALNPRVDLLVKLAELVKATLVIHPTEYPQDPDVLAWYDRMAELKYVSPRSLEADGATKD